MLTEQGNILTMKKMEARMRHISSFIEALKKQLAEAKGEKQKKQVEAKITDDERFFQANEWFDKGNRHDLNKEYDYAIEAYTSVIDLYPNYAEAYYNRGIAYANKGQYDKAIEDYNKAIAIDPNDALAYNNRGVAHGKKGQYDRAIEDYNIQVANLNPHIALNMLTR